uniref:SSD domain-containing protein n=1 Tax=Romanomermis culicivorax TaxID=13658 RepID=A0A915IC75_ROMCU
MLQEMERHFLTYDDDIIDIAFFHSETLNAEIKRNTTSNHLRLRFCDGLLFLLALIIIFSIKRVRKDKDTYIDWTRSKVMVVATGLLGAFMGIISSVGLLTYLQYPYCNAVDVMPFLIIVQPTGRDSALHDRLQEAMGDAAVSITITVLIDVLSFGVGLATDFLAVQIFSVYILVAISITFVYQLTFLLGVLVLSLRAEEQNLHSVIPWKHTIDVNTIDT